MAVLTAKQKQFAEEFIIDLNATKAAIRAGYSEHTAKEIGYENLTKPHIAEYIQQLMDERSNRTQVKADRVLEEYAKIAFADIKNFLSFRTEKAMVGVDEEDDEGKPLYDYRQVIEMKPSEEVDGTMISEVSINAKGVFSFKLHDKKGALDSIAKHLGMFKEEVKHTGEIALTFEDQLRGLMNSERT